MEADDIALVCRGVLDPSLRDAAYEGCLRGINSRGGGRHRLSARRGVATLRDTTGTTLDQARPIPSRAILCVLRVREPTSEDAEAMARVMAAVAEEGSIATEPPVDIEARAERFRETIESEGPAALWVLEDGGRVVGNAGVHEAGAPGVLSLGMAVLPEARGRGGGRRLLDAILEHARACGAHKVELEVWPDNARAIALYASAGFVVEGVPTDRQRALCREGARRCAPVGARKMRSRAVSCGREKARSELAPGLKSAC